MRKRRNFLNKNRNKNNSNSIISHIANNLPKKYEPTTFYPTIENFINILNDINNLKIHKKDKIIEPLDGVVNEQSNFIDNHPYIFPMSEYYKDKTCYLESNPINAGSSVTNSNGQSGDRLYFSSYVESLSYMGDNPIIIEIKFSDSQDDGNKDNIRIDSITFYKDLSLSHKYEFKLEGDSADNDKLSSYNTFGYQNATGNLSKWTVRIQNANKFNFDINNDGMDEEIPEDKYPITFTFDSDNNRIKLEIDQTRNKEYSVHIFNIITNTEPINNNVPVPVPYNYQKKHNGDHKDKHHLPAPYHHDERHHEEKHHGDHKDKHHLPAPYHHDERHHEEKHHGDHKDKHHLPAPYHHDARHHEEKHHGDHKDKHHDKKHHQNKRHKERHYLPIPYHHDKKHHKDKHNKEEQNLPVPYHHDERHQDERHHGDKNNIPVPYNQEDKHHKKQHKESHNEYVPVPYNKILRNDTIPSYKFDKSSNILNYTPLPLNLSNNIQDTVPSYLEDLTTIIIYFDMYMSDLSTDDIFKLKNTICIEALQEVNMCNNIEYLNNNINFIETFNTNEKLKLLVKTKNIQDIEKMRSNLRRKFLEIGLNINKIDIY